MIHEQRGCPIDRDNAEHGLGILWTRSTMTGSVRIPRPGDAGAANREDTMSKRWGFFILVIGLIGLMVILPACSDDDDLPTDPGGSDVTAPTATGITPLDGAIGIDLGENVVFVFSEAMDASSDDGAVSLSAGTITSQTWSNENQTLTVAHEDWPEGTAITATAGIGLTDVAGNALAAAASVTFTTASPTSSPPIIVGMSPNDGATGVSVAEGIVLTFNEAMDTESHVGQVTMSHGDLGIQTWLDDRTLSVGHTDWPEGTEVTVTVGTGLTDAAGTALAEAFTASFWTVSTTVMLLDFSPADGAVDVNRDASITLLFSTEMSDDTIANGVTISDGTRVVYTFTLDGGGDEAYTLDPDDRFPADTEIIVELVTSIQSDAGEHLAEDTVFSFTTGSDIDETPPTIVAFEPANGAIIPPDFGYVRIVFSEPIDTGTFEPVWANAQFLWSMIEMDDPIWNGDGTELTLPLPLDLAPGLSLQVSFRDYADVNGVVQTEQDDWSITVAGTAEIYPFVDGNQLLYTGLYAYGEMGNTEPLEQWDGYRFVEYEARATAGQWNIWESEDSKSEMLDQYDIVAVDAAGIDWLGFAEDNDDKVLEEWLFDSPILFLQYPPAVSDTWQSSTTLTMGDLSFTATLDCEYLAIEDLDLDIFEEDFGFPVSWTDTWKVEMIIDVDQDGEDEFLETRTVWYAPGVGIVREMKHEDNSTDDPPSWEEADFWLLPMFEEGF